jgi:hypothetical protein
VRFWNERETLQVPEQAWELIQLGNCGSPIVSPLGDNRRNLNRTSAR